MYVEYGIPPSSVTMTPERMGYASNTYKPKKDTAAELSTQITNIGGQHFP